MEGQYSIYRPTVDGILDPINDLVTARNNNAIKTKVSIVLLYLVLKY